MKNVVLTDEIKEYIKVRFEQIGNVTYVAEEIIKKFGVNSKPETFRRMVGRFIQDANLKKQNSDIKREENHLRIIQVAVRGQGSRFKVG